jgi:lipoprotein-anchoring transpeptidase ErfK/SrfK
VRNPAPHVALVLAVLTAACSAAGGEVAEPRPAASQTPAPAGATKPAASQTPAPAGATPLPPLLGQGSYIAATIARTVVVFRKPDPATADFVFDTKNPFGQRARFLVVDARRDATGDPWYEIALPIRPNGTTGWVPGDDLRVSRAEDRVVVDLSERTLRRYHQGKLVDRHAVAIGSPDSPTPIGTFFVWARVPQNDPHGPYGVFALGLSGFSDTYTEWAGSNGRIAIHGTSEPGDRGLAVSHGCVRVFNPEMETLTDLPMGTPVVIHR